MEHSVIEVFLLAFLNVRYSVAPVMDTQYVPEDQEGRSSSVASSQVEPECI